MYVLLSIGKKPNIYCSFVLHTYIAPVLRLQGNCSGIARMKGATAAELCSLVHTLVQQQQEDVITEKRPSEPCPRGRERQAGPVQSLASCYPSSTSTNPSHLHKGEDLQAGSSSSLEISLMLEVHRGKG